MLEVLVGAGGGSNEAHKAAVRQDNLSLPPGHRKPPHESGWPQQLEYQAFQSHRMRPSRSKGASDVRVSRKDC